MLELFFGNNAGWFTLPALLGTFFFTLRLVLLFAAGVGADAVDVDIDAGGIDVDAGGDVDLGDAPDGGDHADSTEAFKLLSVQAIAAFLMGFGWAGLGAFKGSGWRWEISLLSAVAGGIAMVWVLTLLLKLIYDLQSSGNVNIQDALGAEGTVYLTVPGDGKRGQVRLVLDGRQRIFNATTEGDSIESKRRVKVTRVNSDNTLTVAAM